MSKNYSYIGLYKPKSLPLMGIDELKGIIPFDCAPVAMDLIEGAKPCPKI